MPAVIVANRHRGAEIVYCGRGTPLGNPYKDGERAQNIERYRKFLWAHIKGWESSACAQCSLLNVKCQIRTELARLLKIDTLILLCSCAPLPCHADVIKLALTYVRGRGSVVL